MSSINNLSSKLDRSRLKMLVGFSLLISLFIDKNWGKVISKLYKDITSERFLFKVISDK